MDAVSNLATQSARQNDSLLDGLKARVVTHAFGIRLGMFGVDYTSKKMTVDPDDKSGRKGRDTRGQEFDTEMERERLRRTISQSTWNEYASTAQAASTASSHPDPAWRRGLSAYAQARDMLLTDISRRASTKLAVA